MALHPDVLAELELEAAARRTTKDAAASLASRVTDLEHRMLRCEQALANAGNAGVTWSALPGFLVQAFREYTAARIEPLINRVTELESRETSETTSKLGVVRQIKSVK